MEENENKIGKQIWTTKNLDVSNYRNGDVIPQVQDLEEWKNLSTGAWCYYENKTGKGSTYGKLYNWYAVNDPRGLAPKGYHIPTDAEWTTLTTYLGTDAAAKMKSTTGWDEDDIGTNESGFAGLPGGYRDYSGDFYDIGANGYWWSSSENSIPVTLGSATCSAIMAMFTVYYIKQNGFSVRCIKD